MTDYRQVPVRDAIREPGAIRQIEGRDWQVVAFVGDFEIVIPADTPTLALLPLPA